ncbi:Long-chain-fatty-acid--CoA ligase FadD15 [Paraconexibacter sp. AEG42_29]|uniref:Acyl-CoA synthetase n=1 Tax=Paraconexibacter sp. AEG42_29 TaxID=2997339 RepID=A0AAU7ASM6_9ACTN
MEASKTTSTTIADLLPRAAEQFAGRVAVRYKSGGAWHDVTFDEVGRIVSEIGRGLIDLGLQQGDRLCLLANTRPEWSYCDFGAVTAGITVVPVYQTNSPAECQWVAGDSAARAIICEDAEQVAKIVAVRAELPALEHIVVMEPSPETDAAGAIPLAVLRERGRGVDEAVLRARTEAVPPELPLKFIYTSGTTGPPKGCVLTHANYRTVLDMVASRGLLSRGDDVVYLFLPLAHSYALLLQLACFDSGACLAYWGRDPQQVIAELSEVQPTYLPSVPRIFEKLYTRVTAAAPPELIAGATQIGLKVRALQAAGDPVPSELQAQFDAADLQLFSKVRAAFGGRVEEAVTGAAPISRNILEFFYACGVPVLEGYGMTETATVATTSTREHHRFGSVGRALPGVDVRIAEEDGEILIRGGNVFAGYHGNAEASFGTIVDGWLHTGDIGRLDEDGYLFITGRKKDIIITAGGKNITPANLENDLKQTRWVSQAVMHGDRRPYPVVLITLDEEEIVPWAKAEGIQDTSVAALASDPRVRALIQEVVDRANANYAPVERVKRFTLLEHDLTQEGGELTPTMKVKRAVVAEKYAARFDALYET